MSKMNLSSIIAALTIVGLLLPSTLLKAQWNQWRGPHRNGLVDRSPPLTNALAGQAAAWRSELIHSGERGGRGSLVIVGEYLYGVSSMPVGEQFRTEVFCLETTKGETVWRSALPEAETKDTCSSTPCVVDGRVYVAGSGNKVHCLDAADGTSVWEASLERKNHQAVASSIAIADATVVILADVLTGLDANTGDVLWTNKDVDGYESSPAVWRNGQRTLVICNTRLETHAVDPASGAIIWTVDGGGRSTPVVAQEYGGDFLVIMSQSRKNGLTGYALTESGPKKLWTNRVYDRAASPVVFDGHVYAIAGGSNGHGAKVLCVHMDTGETAWEEIISFAEVSSPIVVDGKLVAICGSMLQMIQATPERYVALSQANLQITLCTSPAIAEGRIFVREAKAIACYDLRVSP